LLSALESILKIWEGARKNEKRAQQAFATEHPFPVVSFIRIGRNTMSKSSLINKIMCDGTGNHNFFFHKDINGGDIERKIVDGLVELCWYLPSGSEEQTLKKEICFANLRGDAKYFKKQLNVLSKISSVFCILLPSEYPDQTVTKILNEVAHYKAQVILIFCGKKRRYTTHFFSQLREKHSKKLALITRAKKNNEPGFIQNIRELIQKYILAVKEIPLAQLASCATQLEIHLDGCKKLEENINAWLEQEKTEAKGLLKLQTHIPVLASLERQKHCPNQRRNISISVDEIYGRIIEETEAQKKSFHALDERIVEFLRHITFTDESNRNYVLVKIKLQ
jgi:hypothetical protein